MTTASAIQSLMQKNGVRIDKFAKSAYKRVKYQEKDMFFLRLLHLHFVKYPLGGLSAGKKAEFSCQEDCFE
jgi:hypothetical protein